MVKDLPEQVIFGKGPGGKSVPNDTDGHVPMWKKKFIFWDLSYWKHLEVRSSINVIYVTKNLSVNLLGLLGVYGKTKDTLKAREDQKRMNEKDGMHPKQYEGAASYALTKAEKEIFFECLLSIKAPSGFLSNIKGIINMAEKKFQNLKSHDCHVIMTQPSTRKCSSSHCEAMCISQCNFSEGNRSRRPNKVTGRFGSMSCQFQVGVPTILQYYDARPG